MKNYSPAVKCKTKKIDPDKLSILDRCYWVAIGGALQKTGGKLSLAAKLLDISNVTARKHAKRLGLWPMKTK